MKKFVFDLDIAELAEYMKSISEPPYRAAQVFSALHNGVNVSEISNIPKSVRERIIADFNCVLPELMDEVCSNDGTRKVLLHLHDDSLIECVLLTQSYGNTICVSSQVGCRMGCKFCASGKDGIVRNLTAGEMLAQVIWANKNGKVSNVVIMGSGEPFDNFDNTVKFLRLVTVPDGVNIGARGISVSTVGLPDKIRAFADLQTQVNLCISLHAPNDEVRTKIIPLAKKYPIADIMASAKYFFDKTKRRVIFEYSLIDGINCDLKCAQELAVLLKHGGFAYHVNLINLNKTGDLKPPPRTEAMAFMDYLIKAGISCTMRVSRGSDIAGACGQLRTKIVLQNTPASSAK